MKQNELFNLFSLRIIQLGQTRSIAFRFSRLDHEPFREPAQQYLAEHRRERGV